VDPAAHPVVFFDGCCGVCNKSVDFMLSKDRDSVLRFAPLQGETAQGHFADMREDDLMRTLWLLDEKGLHNRSTAVLRAFKRLHWPLKAVSWLLAVPRPVRDWAYDLFARNRYRFAGRSSSCRIPSPAERAVFLP
jgi:predicted DCC family thiol-disulfide oxidoreductase YuxK